MELLDSTDQDAELSRQLAGSPSSTPTAASLLARPSPGEAAGAGLELSPAAGGAALAAGQRRTIEIVLAAVGVGLQFVHLEEPSGDSGRRSAGGSHPGSAGGSRAPSATDLVRATPAPAASAAALQPGQGQGPAGQGRAVQMLAAHLDLEADYRIEVGGMACAVLG